MNAEELEKLLAEQRHAQQALRVSEARLAGIIDTGLGMAPESLAHIFDRFWQASRTDSRGVGLGLSIVKGIVEAHRGQLRMERAPGRGSTFPFTIPRVKPL